MGNIHWEKEAKRYCGDAIYWRQRSVKAEAEVERLKKALDGEQQHALRERKMAVAAEGNPFERGDFSDMANEKILSAIDEASEKENPYLPDGYRENLAAYQAELRIHRSDPRLDIECNHMNTPEPIAECCCWRCKELREQHDKAKPGVYLADGKQRKILAKILKREERMHRPDPREAGDI